MLLVVAVTIEALIEYVKCFLRAYSQRKWQKAAVHLFAIVVSCLLCFAARVDLFAVLGMPFAYPWVGTLLTGIFASRGAQYVGSLAGRLERMEASATPPTDSTTQP